MPRLSRYPRDFPESRDSSYCQFRRPSPLPRRLRQHDFAVVEGIRKSGVSDTRLPGSGPIDRAGLEDAGVGTPLDTFATPWAKLLDVLPIVTIVLLYFWAILLRAHRVSCSQAALFTLAFALAAVGFACVVGATSIGKDNATYMAAWLLIVSNAAVLGWRGHRLAPWLRAGAGIFAASIAMRMADHPVCDSLPIGTHFLWHLLNGALFAVLLTDYVRHCPR